MQSNATLYTEEQNGSYRKPTDEELIEALKACVEREALLAKLATIQDQLAVLYDHPSKVFYDSAGFPYDVRTFIASGRTATI